jgi:hypothetical protein
VKILFAVAALHLALLLPASAQTAQHDHPSAKQIEQLVQINGATGQRFGNSIAMSGNTLVVGPNPTNGACEAAYVYQAPDGNWADAQLTATLTATTGCSGAIVAISGNTIAVSGGDTSTGSGVVYIYVNPSGAATQTAELSPSIGNAASLITSLAIEGSTVVAGYYNATYNGQTLGSAYVFVKPAAGWTNASESAQLNGSDEAGDWPSFGTGVAVSGHNVVVGAGGDIIQRGTVPGRAYLFVEPAGGWSGSLTQTTEFSASDETEGSIFGTAVAMSGDTIVVGAPAEMIDSVRNEGAVYVFTEPSSGWPASMTETAELTQPHKISYSQLGYSVSISGPVIAAGAIGQRKSNGVVYLYFEPSGGWQTTSSATPLVASDGNPTDGEVSFGWNVVIDGDVLGVSAPFWPSIGSNSEGAVYVFGEGQ